MSQEAENGWFTNPPPPRPIVPKIADNPRPKTCKHKSFIDETEHLMTTCEAPVHFLGSERAASEGRYSGWYHDDPELDLRHWAVWDASL